MFVAPLHQGGCGLVGLLPQLLADKYPDHLWPWWVKQCSHQLNWNFVRPRYSVSESFLSVTAVSISVQTGRRGPQLQWQTLRPSNKRTAHIHHRPLHPVCWTAEPLWGHGVFSLSWELAACRDHLWKNYSLLFSINLPYRFFLPAMIKENNN